MSSKAAAWILVTVVAPLMVFDVTHRWEEDQTAGEALWWAVIAVPVLAAVIAVRSAVVRAAAISVGFLAATMAFYRWIIPLSGDADWPVVWSGGLLGVIAGTVIGRLIGRRWRRESRTPTRRGYAAGAIVAVAGLLLAPAVVRLGAEDSTAGYDEGRYGEIGRPGVVALPKAGRYAIMAMGFSPYDPDCRIAGRRAEKVAVPPADYGGDFATYAWVATFSVPAAGAYTLSCDTSDEEARYTVGEVPEIRGAVGALIHWPVLVIGLLGSVPGLLIVASTYRRRRLA